MEPVKQRWISPLRDRTRVIPFVVPTKEEQMSALGSLAGQKWRLKKSLLAIIDDFEPIRKPEPGDNLYEFEEDEQGFGLFSSISRNHIDIESQVIYIAVFYCNISKGVIQRIKKSARAFFYGAKVKFHDYGSSVNLEQFFPMESEKGQKYYDASRMNSYFAKHLPKATYSITVLTNLLIYNGNNPNPALAERWCFGLGSMKDRTSVISFQEIVKHGYGVRDESEQQCEKNIEFLLKVVNHELCHTFGMRHCIYYTCLMNGSNHYEEAVRKVPHLCPVCLRKLQLALQFDLLERYEALADQKSLELATKIIQALKLQKL